METYAIAKYIRISPQKMRLVVDQIRGKSIEKALEILEYSNKKAAGPIKKTLESAVANAEHNEGADIDELLISKAMVDEGPTLKRFRARAKGRGTRILKRTSHIRIAVSDDAGAK